MTQEVKSISAFRSWVREIWLANCEEHQLYGEPQLSVEEYWARYKYWLKHKYRREHSEHSRDTAYSGSAQGH
jgi:hypothetical protein